MNDSERKEMIQSLVEMYSPLDVSIAVARMPLEVEDEDGAMFEEYSTFLESMFAARTSISEEDNPTEVMRYKQTLLDIAYKYRYPTNQILLIGDR